MWWDWTRIGKWKLEIGNQKSEVTRSPVLERLLARGWEFDFFQAVWLLERLHENRTPVGQRGPVAAESIRFRPNISLGFPSTDVRRITAQTEPGSRDPVYRIDLTFLGLYGVATPLPLHYAIDILRAVETNASPQAAPALPGEPPPSQEGEKTEAGAPPQSASATAEGPSPARDFLDILHHRLTSLFYRSWTKYRYDVTFGMQRDVITLYLLWLIGLRPNWPAKLLGVSPLRLIRYAGLLTQHPRSAATLEGMLLDYWDGIPVNITQFIGRWVALKPADLNRIGMLNSRLDTDLTVGEQVYDITGAFRIAVGPVDWQTYLTFLPDGQRYAETRSLVHLYGTDPLSFSIEVRLQAGEAPELKLSSDDQASRLGYTSWARTDDLPETSVTFEAGWTSPLGGVPLLSSSATVWSDEQEALLESSGTE